MKRASILLAVAAIMYVGAWLLPVAEGGTTLAKGGLPGWEALVVAFGPVLPKGNTGDAFVSSAMGVISGLTNVWFILSCLLLVRSPVRFHRLVFWGLVLCVLLDAWWFVRSLPTDEGVRWLRVGYYVWWASFAVLAGAAHTAALASADTPGVGSGRAFDRR